MPLYEFVCSDCDARTDVRATIAELDAGLVATCAACGSDTTRRALPTIALRGRASASAVASTASPSGGGCGGGCACACGG